MIVWANNKISLARASAVSVIVLGTIVIIGWHSKNTSLIQILPQFVPMQYNTALVFILCGAGLLLCLGGNYRLTRIIASVIALAGVLTLFEYFFQADFGIDQLFMQHYITVGAFSPGRMSPNTAICFVLAASILLLASNTSVHRQSSLVVGVLGSAILGLSTIALLGYVFEIQPEYAWGRATRMALHTAIGLMVLGAGLLANELSTAKDWNRHWWPASVSIAFITIAVMLTAALDAEMEQKQIITAANSFNPTSLVILVFGIAIGIIIFIILRMMQSANLRVAELNALSAQLTFLSNTDHLTQLYNRLYSDHSLNEEIVRAARFGRDLAVILVDIDNFKGINDTYGHQAGDEVIVIVASLLKRRSRSIDIIGRYGGEEFIIICPETGKDGALLLAESLRKDMEKTDFGKPGKLTFSAGVAILETNDTLPALVRKADKALYRAKANGRNQVTT